MYVYMICNITVHASSKKFMFVDVWAVIIGVVYINMYACTCTFVDAGVECCCLL